MYRRPKKTHTSFWEGKSFCGRRGGLAFRDVIRVDAMTRKCPNETLPCSYNTGAEETVCYSEEDIRRGLCPINYLNFTLKHTGFHVTENLHFESRKDGSGLPIVSTKLSPSQPCSKPLEVSQNRNLTFYPLENAKFQ